MLRVKNPKQTPNPPFRYTQPETLITLESIDFTALMDKVQDHRRQYGLDLSPGWTLQIEKAMCESLGWKNVCHEVDENPEKLVSSSDVKNFLTTLAHLLDHAITGEETFVSQEEANRRAVICKGCPNNTKGIIQWCSFCPGGVLKAMNKFIDYFRPKKSDLTTPHDAELFACKVCHCSNSAQVHVSTTILNKVKGNYQYPNHCWK